MIAVFEAVGAACLKLNQETMLTQDVLKWLRRRVNVYLETRAMLSVKAN